MEGAKKRRNPTGFRTMTISGPEGVDVELKEDYAARDPFVRTLTSPAKSIACEAKRKIDKISKGRFV
jgi:hypothetical protein